MESHMGYDLHISPLSIKNPSGIAVLTDMSPVSGADTLEYLQARVSFQREAFIEIGGFPDITKIHTA